VKERQGTNRAAAVTPQVFIELKHDRLSGNEDAKVKPMEISPNLNLDITPLLYI
jgi:hypothetical protein